MPKTQKTLISRKDISAMTSLTVDVIRFNEGCLGLLPSKRQLGPRRVAYIEHPAIAALRERKLVED